MELLPFKMDYLTEEMVNQAEKELGENEEIRNEALAAIKLFLKGKPDLVCPQDDKFLLAFFRKSKFDIQKGIKYYQDFLRDKLGYPEIFGTGDFSPISWSILEKIVHIKEYRDQDGTAIILMQFQHWKLDEMKFSTLVLPLAFLLLSTVEYEATQVCGLKLILDGKDICWKHVLHIELRYLHLAGKGLKSSLPIRIKGIHLVNESSNMKLIWRVISLYLGAKLRSRVHFHGTNRESLLQHFDRRVLPKEYGGTLPNDNSYCIKEMATLEDIFVRRVVNCYYK